MGRRSAFLPIRVRPLSTCFALVPARAPTLASAPLYPYVKKPCGYDRKDRAKGLKGLFSIPEDSGKRLNRRKDS